MAVATARPDRVPVRVAPTGAELRGLAAPQVLESLQRLAAAVGSAAALEAWTRAAVSSGKHGMQLDVQDLTELAQHLVAEGGAVGMFARSLSARCRAYSVLSRHGG